MSNDNKGAGDTEVSGAEAVATKYNKNMNKNVKITTYSEKKINTAKNTEKFEHSGAEKIEKMKLLGSVNFVKEGLKKGSIKTREFFTGKVLNKGISHKGTHISKTAFEQMSLEQQNEIYSSYLDNRMSGKTDAYGNVNVSYNKNNGGNQPTRKTEEQIITENKAIEDEEIATKISEEEYKKRRGLKGSRSMFANSGGRGFYDPV